MILCCGEALIDMLPREAKSGESAFAPHVGGSVFNSALALGRLETPAGFFSGLSDDLFGVRLQAALRESRVDLTYARISSLPTTLAFVTLADGQASYFFYDENTAGRMLSESDLPRLDDGVEALLFGGISLATEPCGGTYEALMAREASTRVTMLDPNIRPVFIKDAETHRARMRRMMAMADIVKISEEDLAWLGGTGGHAEAARDLLGAGTKLVVITSGGRGAAAFWNGGSAVVEAVPVEVVDTVGAGDAFNAGMLAALREAGALSKAGVARLQEGTVRDALAFAARVAAITVSRAGANPPWRAEM
ncbi:carbohydrate kinase [Chelativorans sp. M5D2P16]|uniref:carbohydrate kinase family protein n=1 Tax=Chelativorans sp. M5D2P16 TaxID=3095678 RepID=UPI002ACA0D3F|nr:carbohydrate kinase [Chelativorans sp. M5D2P16]MDZ5698412.1 carbohydrate kinase [Chelativorans sp. M5D2P16]